jgi:hypothetical protein
MALLNLSVKHGQTWDVAQVNFVKGIEAAREQFGLWIQRVEWSAGRTSAQLFGPGFVVEMSVDLHEVHARGDLPAIAKLFEAPLKNFLERTFSKSLPGSK